MRVVRKKVSRLLKLVNVCHDDKTVLQDFALSQGGPRDALYISKSIGSRRSIEI